MRSRLVLVIAAIAIVGGAGAAAARSTHSPAASAARPLKATYLFKAEFGMGYELVWSDRSGSQSDPCSEWRLNSGMTELDGGSRGTLPTARIKIAQYPDSESIQLRTVGMVDGVFRRTLTQTGGSTWSPSCGGNEPPPFVPPANDCRGANGLPQEWQYAKQGALTDATARGFRRLDQLTDLTNPHPGFTAIGIAATPTASPYDHCMTSFYAPEFPYFVKLPVRLDDIVALRKLKPGHRRRIQKIWGGPCKAADEIPPESECRFHLDIHVDIRRVRKGPVRP